MEPDKIKNFIENARKEGYSDSDIQSYLANDLKYSEADYIGFFSVDTDPKKKNSQSPLTSGVVDSASLFAAGSSVGEKKPDAGVPEPFKMPTTQWMGEESRVAQNNRVIELGSQIDKINTIEGSVDDAFKRGQTANNSSQNAGGTVIQWGPTNFYNNSGVGPSDDSETALINKVTDKAWSAGAQLLELNRNELHQDLSSYYEDANALAKQVADDESIELFKLTPDGVTVDVPTMLKINDEFERIERENTAALKAELKKQEGFSEVNEVLYDMNTGVRGIANSFVGLYANISGDRGLIEKTQYDNYMSQFRTQASLVHDGLNQEQIDRGISGNIEAGDLDAAFTIFNTQLAQTAPQLAMQVALSYGTAGLASGIGATASAASVASRVVGSSFMGLSTMGTSLTDSYGQASDSQRWLSAFGNAAIETMSEYLFQGDVDAILKSNLKGMTRREIRDAVFKKGLMSEEMKRLAVNFAKQGATNFVKNGFEEGVEEFVSSVGSGIIDSVVNGREGFSISEAVDSFIVGFGAGAGSSAVGGLKSARLAKAALASVGVVSSNIMQINAAKAQAVEAVRTAASDAQKTVAQNQVRQLDLIATTELNEEQSMLSNYSDSDLDTITSLYHQVRDAALQLANPNVDERTRQEWLKKGKKANAELKAMKAKYSDQATQVQLERSALSNFDFGDTGTVEITGDTDAQGSKFVSSLNSVVSALGGNKMFVHRDYDAMSSSTGIEKTELVGSRGIYKSDDGSIHIMLPAATSNTAFHEAYHAVARSIDPKYLSKFIDAVTPSIMSLPESVRSKYSKIYSAYKNSPAVLAEEIFAEINADITDGLITVENVGASLSNAAAVALNSAIRKLGIKVDKYQSFTDFTNYVKNVSENLKSGERIVAFSDRVFETPEEGKEMMRQIVGTRGKLNNFDVDSLLTAETMLKNGKSMDEVFAVTGWYKQHGDWKMEVPYGKPIGGIQGMRDKISPLISTTAEEFESVKDDDYGKKFVYLEDVLDAKKLYEIYPEIKKLKVGSASSTEDFSGVAISEYNEKTGNQDIIGILINSLYLDVAKAESVMATIVHEIQHVIQAYEGFPVGGSTDAFGGRIDQNSIQRFDQIRAASFLANKYSKVSSQVKKIASSVDALSNSNFDKDKTINVIRKAIDNKETIDGGWSQEYNGRGLLDAFNIAIDKLRSDETTIADKNIALRVVFLILHNNKSSILRKKLSDSQKSLLNGFYESFVDSYDNFDRSFDQLSVEFAYSRAVRYKFVPVNDEVKDKVDAIIGNDSLIAEDAINAINSLIDEKITANQFVGLFKKVSDDVSRTFDKTQEILSGISKYELYKSLAGETESRNTELRARMSDEARAFNIPIATEDIAQDKQVVSRPVKSKFDLNLWTELTSVDYFDDYLFSVGSDTLEGAELSYGIATPSTEIKFLSQINTTGTTDVAPFEDMLDAVMYGVNAVVGLEAYGFTYNMADLTEPPTGYMVGNGKNEQVIPLIELERMTQEERRAKIGEMLKGIREAGKTSVSAHVGGWIDDGEFFLDLSERYEDKEVAIKLGLDRNERAIYDLNIKDEIKMADVRGRRFMAQIDETKIAAPVMVDSIPSKPLNNSLAYKGAGVPFVTMQQVIEDFRKENGRDPKIAFWMGDQSGYGEYKHSDGSVTKLEGGMGHTLNKANKDRGVVWATNKTQNGIGGTLGDADIVAEVSGHPVKSSRFYKGHGLILAKNFMIGWKAAAGKTVSFGNVDIVVPEVESNDPIDSLKSALGLIIEAQGQKASAVLVRNLEYLMQFATIQDYLNDTKRGKFISDFLGDFEKPEGGAIYKFFRELGIPTESEVSNEMRDGYLVENNFQEGDVYLYYKLERNKNGKIKTSEGSHSTYQTDIHGTPIGIAAARENIFEFIPEYYHIREAGMSGHGKIKYAIEIGLRGKDGKLVVQDGIDVDSMSDKDAAVIVKRITREVKKLYDSDRSNPEYRNLYEIFNMGKSRRVKTTENLADKQKMRVMNSQATIMSGSTLMFGLSRGMTFDKKVNFLNKKFKELVKDKFVGYEAVDINTVLDYIYGKDIRGEGADSGRAAYQKYENLTSTQGILHQATLHLAIVDMIKGGMTKGEIKNQLIEDGFSPADAEALYQKANGYKLGINQGRREGVKSRNQQFADAKRAERASESEVAKSLRERAKLLYAREKRVTDAILVSLVELAEEVGNVKITLSQVKQIVRTLNSAHAKVYGKNFDQRKNNLVFRAAVDKIVKIVEKQYTAQQLAEYNDLVRKVRTKQRAIATKFKELPRSSKSPLISYADQIRTLTTIEPSYLEMNSLKSLADGLKSLEETTKMVNASIDSEGIARINKPYVNIAGVNVDFRRSKVYFSELADALLLEANAVEHAQLQEEMYDIMEKQGVDYVEAMRIIMNERMTKELSSYEKALKAIAEELELNLDNVADLESALAEYALRKTSENDARMNEIINNTIAPTAVLWADLLATNVQMADIFGLNQGLEGEALFNHIVARMNRLTVGQLRRVEFAMFDFVVNGRALGSSTIAAEVKARNEGRDQMASLNMKANVTADKKGGAIRNYVFGWLETTPTFFRRIFLYNSEDDVVKYMEALGFSRLRRNTAIADQRHATVMQFIYDTLKENGMNTAYGETALQIYSMVMQKPEGTSDAQWVLNLRKQFETALEKDRRYNDDIKSEKAKAVREMFYDGGRPLNLIEVQSKLEGITNLVETWSVLGSTFEVRAHELRNYVENFLGQEFNEQPNYLPFSFRLGTDNETLEAMMESQMSVRQALDTYNKNKLGARAKSTYERNPDAMSTQGRYIDLNFFGTIDATHKENEIKIATSSEIAYVSEMTSERNPEFVNSIGDEQLREQVRQKIYSYMIDQRGAIGDEMLSDSMKKWVNTARNWTVLYYFGAIFDQIAKQSAPMWNTLVETKSMDSKLEFIRSLYGVAMAQFSGKYVGDEDFKYELAKNYDIQSRNIQEAVISFTGGKPAVADESMFEKGMNISTFSMRATDKVVATASWFAYYKEWMYRYGGMSPQQFSWEEASKTPNDEAADWASMMVSKDQNISSGRDRSRFGRYTKGNAIGILKMVGIPFIDFLMNKKMNMMIDVQKAMYGKDGIKGDAARSLAGTAMEVLHFQTMTWMVLAPIYAGLGSIVFGADDEEDSWFSKKFNYDLWLKGMLSDVNPLVLPFKFVEDLNTEVIDLVRFTTSEQGEKALAATGGDFTDAYELWKKTDGLPTFGGPRGDSDFVLSTLSNFGVIGAVGVQFYTAINNIATLQKDIPSFMTASGKEKFVTQDEALKLTLMEFAKSATLTVGFATGLMSKEITSSIKAAERGLTKRATTNENTALERIVAENMSQLEPDAVDLLIKSLDEKVLTDPQNAKSWSKDRKKGIKNELKQYETKDDKYIATLRDIDARFKNANELAFALQRIVDTYEGEERANFLSAALVYYAIEGREEIRKGLKSQILIYGDIQE